MGTWNSMEKIVNSMDEPSLKINFQLRAWKSFVSLFFFLVRTRSVKLMNSWQQAISMPGSRTGRNWSLTWRSTVDRFGRLIHLRILWSSLMLILSWEDIFCDGRNLESNDKALVKCWFSKKLYLSPSKTRLHCAFDNDRREKWHLVTSHLL